MIINATLVSVAPPAAKSNHGHTTERPHVAVDASVFVDRVTQAHRNEHGARITDATATLYAPIGHADKLVAGARVIVRRRGRGDETMQILHAVHNEAGMSTDHVEAFLKGL